MDRFLKLRNLLKTNLELTENEVEIFLDIVKVEKKSLKTIQKHTSIQTDEIIRSSRSLIRKGMIIEINDNEYRALHPRFAVVNRYRQICNLKKIPFGKNLEIDRLGVMLESYQNITEKSSDM